MTFSQGHALIIGVGSYCDIPGADVPVAAVDARAVAGVLQESQVCGYPSKQIHLLLDDKATREGTLKALKSLGEQVGEQDTLLIFYCGHGAAGEDGNYYFVSHDARARGGRVVPGTGVRDAEFIELLRKIPSKRILVVLNTCFSGMVSPSLSLEQGSLEIQTPPEDTNAALLATGSGRIIITASGENQKSWIGRGPHSIFTQAFIDGLRGKGVANRGGTISVYDLYSAIYEAVIEASAEQYGQKQEPELTILKGVGPFPVALYLGATSLGEFDTSQPAPDLPSVRHVKPEKAQRRLEIFMSTINTGGGDYTGGDKIKHHTTTRTGNITKSTGVAIGENIDVRVEQHGKADET